MQVSADLRMQIINIYDDNKMRVLVIVTPALILWPSRVPFSASTRPVVHDPVHQSE